MLKKSILFVLFICLSKTIVISAPYVPLYSTNYDNVENYIKTNWNSAFISGSGTLPNSYISLSPGWNWMFYWDNYFLIQGLLLHSNVNLYAKNNTDNMLYTVNLLGFMPNATATWGQNRSQPPYLSMMVRDVYENMTTKNKTWLKSSYITLKKEYNFWVDSSATPIENHTTSIHGLQRYSHHASVSDQIAFYGQIADRFGWSKTVSDTEKQIIGSPMLAEAATGMDFTPRFEQECPDFVALDLNCNLYLYELNFAWMVTELGLTGEPDWQTFADKRAALVRRYCWNSNRGLYMNYNYKTNKFPSVACAISFSAMYAGIASNEEAASMVNNLPLFELDFGISTCENTVQKNVYQWDYPVVWAPLQFLVYKGIKKYGYDVEAKRVANKFLDVVAKNYLSPVPSDGRSLNKTYEKYNGSNGQIFNGEYPSAEMMGWTAGVYVYFNNEIKKVANEIPVLDIKSASIYPNVVTNSFTLSDVSLSDLNYIVITGSDGRKVKLIRNYTGGPIHVDELSTGVYTVSLIYTNNTARTLKLIKE